MGYLSPTLNIVEGCLGGNEGLEWDTSDLKEIPEEMEDWGSGWNNPEEYDENWILTAPCEVYGSDKSYLEYDTDPEEYFNNPEEYDENWIWPTPCEIYYSEESSLEYETDPEEYFDELQLVLQRTPYRYQSTWIPGNSPMEEKCVQKKKEGPLSPSEHEGKIYMKKDGLLLLRDLDQPIEVQCKNNQGTRTDHILAERIDYEGSIENKINTEIEHREVEGCEASEQQASEYDEFMVYQEPLGNSNLLFGMMASEVFPHIERLSAPTRAPDPNGLQILVHPGEQSRPDGILEPIQELEESHDGPIESQTSSEKCPDLQVSKEVETGELVELFDRACGIQEPAGANRRDDAEATNLSQSPRGLGARPKEKRQKVEVIRSDEDWMEAVGEGDLVVGELETRSAVPEMQVEKVCSVWLFATMTKGAGQQRWPQPNRIDWGGCNGPGYY